MVTVNTKKAAFINYLQHSTTSEYSVPEMRYEEEPKHSIAHTPEYQSESQELQDERGRLEEEAAWAVQVSRAIIDFAKCWMKFVMERCGRGRGVRPRYQHFTN